jgi:hypothetical protein
MTKTQPIDKGGLMEETLRDYFLDMGYFVVRGIKYKFSGIDITDVDLWLYQRTSPFKRERTNVDIKNKRIPQALERILWTKGLKECLRLDSAIVATTDSRKEVRAFADLQQIGILDGQFLARLKKHYGLLEQRLSEEELLLAVRPEKGDRIGEHWVDRLTQIKSRVLSQLDFDGCNTSVNDCRFFIEQSLAVAHKSEAAYRLIYFTLALILVTVDFVMRDFAFIEKPQQAIFLNDGFRFGSSGKNVADKVFSMAGRLMASGSGKRNVNADVYVKQLRDEAQGLPVEILTEFILRKLNGTALLELARSFESLAYSKAFTHPTLIPSENRAFIGVMLDFLNVDRQRFFGPATQVDLKAQAAPSSTERQPHHDAQTQQASQQLEMKISEKPTERSPEVQS